MPRFTVKFHQAVWETTTFDVEAESAEQLADMMADGTLEALMGEAIENDEATTELGDNVQSMDSDWAARDENDKQVQLHALATALDFDEALDDEESDNE